ncbi:hypothetical protein KNU96_gp80 [Xanthomonas phage FoX5]|uniref:Uncharacterized protein n=1 Tax=Xanthomonas phage FoX5 TaxID=2723901 RepID=A0A858NP09_9CAUD|nr:hypothetical protein KNU96_gp80 [Xanthomonas phage FoX5]QJB22010.1 hypothetical protein XccvBFoX5_gp32c [Xanthomonas phage FoX5]
MHERCPPSAGFFLPEGRPVTWASRGVSLPIHLAHVSAVRSVSFLPLTSAVASLAMRSAFPSVDYLPRLRAKKTPRVRGSVTLH